MKNRIIQTCTAVFLKILITVLFESCEFTSDSGSRDFSLPEPGLWTIRYTDTEGNARTIAVAGNSFSIETSDNRATPVLAFRQGDEFPVGAIYPWTGALAAEDGFSASVLYTMILSATGDSSRIQNSLSTFNWLRFMEECRNFGDNAWLLDKERIMEKIAGGKFKKTDLKIKNT